MMENMIEKVISFPDFKQIVLNMGGIWASGHVRFTQFCDGYGALYRLNSNDSSMEKQAITYNTESKQFSYIPPEEWERQHMVLVRKLMLARNQKWKELEAQGYRSGGCGNDFEKCAIVQGDYPNGKIVGYLNQDLTITWR